VRCKTRVLVEGLDTRLECVTRGIPAALFAIEEDLAAVWFVSAREHLDQSRLAGTVVTNETDNFTGVELEARAVESYDRAVAL
jgi:hypothetical protein